MQTIKNVSDIIGALEGFKNHEVRATQAGLLSVNLGGRKAFYTFMLPGDFQAYPSEVIEGCLKTYLQMIHANEERPAGLPGIERLMKVERINRN